MYRRIFFILIFVSNYYVNAQISKRTFDLSLNAGFGSFNQSELHGLNSINESSLPFSVKSIDNFDPGIYYGASVGTNISTKGHVSIIYQYYYTGSRIGRKDYSGYYSFDQILNGHLIGFEPEMYLLNGKTLYLSMSVQAGSLFSGVKLREILIVGSDESKDSKDLRAFSFSITPKLNFSVPLHERLRCFISLGRMIDTKGAIHLVGNKDAILILNNSKVKTDWSGWRIALGLNINMMNY